MKVLLEGSSLFFKNYTGIPYYILNLHQSMKAQEGVDAVLGFRMKKKFGKHMPRQREILKHDHLWYLGKFMIPLLRPQVAHTLHTPFLDINRALKVATIHDMAVHLPQFREYGLASQYFVEKRFKLLGEFAKKADALITVSDATKNDFLRFFDFPEDRIHVVPLAPSTFVPQGDVPGANNILDRFKLEKKRFFLFVGGISTRKNSINLIKAYQQSKSRRDFKLVIAGNSQEIPHKVALEYIDQNNLAKDILLTGYTEKDE